MPGRLQPNQLNARYGIVDFQTDVEIRPELYNQR